MAWNSYGLDREAQQLVLVAKKWDSSVLNQSFKMRLTAAYGLERFWGEHLRFKGKEPIKSRYWKATWDSLARILERSEINLPNDLVDINDAQAIELMSEKLWQIDIQDQRIALSVLTQLCDCMIWWTQRYKG